jgi:hypothetical protein
MTNHFTRSTRTFSFFLLILAFILCFSAKSFALSWAQSYGLGSYDTNGAPATDPFYCSGSDAPLAVAKMPDGGFVVAGYLAMPGVWRTGGAFGTRGWLGALVRYAADGTILWQTLLRQDNDLYQNGYTYHALNDIGQIATDAQGNIFVCGGKGSPVNGSRTPFVAKFSPQGALLWENGFDGGTATVGDPPQTVPIGVSPASYLSLTSDGGVLVTLAQGRPNVPYTIPVLAKFNANGSLAFTKGFDNQAQYLGSTPVCQSKDGTRYVMAFLYATDGSASGERYGLLLLVTDTAGNIVAQRGYNHSDGPGETPSSIIATNDGGFAVLSKLPNDQGFLLRKLSSDLSTEVFKRRVVTAFSNGGGYLAGNSLVETTDGGFLIGGTTQKYGSTTGTDVLLMKLNSTGDFVFASLLGGPRYEGYPSSFGPGTSIATELVGGGYGFAAGSGSYHVGEPVSGAYHLTDWWIAKTDSNRHMRNFSDMMEDMSSSDFTITGSPEVAANPSTFSPPNYPYGLTTTATPSFVLENLALETSPDLPTLMIQASGPRILSSHTAETIVEQHFSYHITTAYFPPGSQLTYSADGLPQDFRIDSQTGIISGIAHVGSETVENNLPPIPITVHATDGTDMATSTFDLAISDGSPVFSVTAASNQANPVLSFTCLHLGKQSGRVMNVEYMAPDHPGLWQWLPNGSNGYMTYDVASAHYVLNSTNYPQQNGVRFRAKLTVQGRDPLISNEVGPFDLASGTARAGQPVLSMVRNGTRADFDFYVTELSAPTSVAVRVQSTITPSAEGTWVDLQDTGAGHMTQEGQSNLFTHKSNDVPPVNAVYFRAVASASGLVDSISNIIGPYNLISDTPPTVTLTAPTAVSGNGQDETTPLIYQVGSNGTINLHFSGTASFPAGSPRSIKTLQILVDGSPIQTVNGANSISVDYLTSRIGFRTLELLAIDDLGATARAGTGALHIKLTEPAGSLMNRISMGGKLHPPTVTQGRTYDLHINGANWDNANAWEDFYGNHGVPGPNDEAVVGGLSVTFSRDIEVGSLCLIGTGRLVGPAIITVDKKITIYDGSAVGFVQLILKAGGLCEMLNKADVSFDGTIENFGTWRMRGRGGLVGLAKFTGRPGSTSDFQMPLLTPAAVSAGLPATPRVLSTASLLNSGNITVSGIVAQGGGNIVAQGGGNIVAQGGGNLVNGSGGTIVAQGGGNIVAQGGGNIVAQGGGNIVAQGGGNVAIPQGSCLISPDGARIVAQGGGNIVAQGAGNIVAQGGGNIVAQGAGNRPGSAHTPTGSAQDGFIQTGGTTDLNYVTITGSVDVQGGMLSGSGMIDGSLTMSGGIIAPGHSSGQMLVTGDYSQSSDSTMILDAVGGEPGQFDQVQVAGQANLAGALQFHTSNGFAPLPDDPFNPVGYATLNGNFEYSSPNGELSVNPNGMLLVMEPTATNPLNLTSVVSRKVHGAAGPYDIVLPLTGPGGVECRNSSGNHSIIFFFSNNITSAGASLNSATGNAAPPTISANTVTINLSGIGNGQQLSVTLQGVIDEFGQTIPDVTVPIRTLVGDTNGNGSVNATDVSQTKIQSGQAVTASNFRADVTVNGTINATDVSLVKLRSGTGISGSAQ